MTMEWHPLCRGDNRIEVEGDSAIVSFDDGRSHRVDVSETDETWELGAIVARASQVKGIENLVVRIWRQNRVAQLTGFRIDKRGRIYAYGWVPKVGLSAQEFRLI